MATRISAGARNGAVNAIADLNEVGAGTAVIQLRTGAPPAAITDAAAGTLLAEFNNLQDPAFDNAPTTAVGVAALLGVPLAEVGLAAGTIGHARWVNQNGDCVLDTDSVGTSGTLIIVNTLTVSVGVDVELVSFTMTMPASV